MRSETRESGLVTTPTSGGSILSKVNRVLIDDLNNTCCGKAILRCSNASARRS